MARNRSRLPGVRRARRPPSSWLARRLARRSTWAARWRTIARKGQKLSIHVSGSVHALAADGSPLLHVDSYARVMKLLGHTTDAEGFVHLTRGFQTDHLAETSLDFVWCALRAACPLHPTLATALE